MNQEEKEQRELKSSENIRFQRASLREILDAVWKNEILLDWGAYWASLKAHLKSDTSMGFN